MSIPASLSKHRHVLVNMEKQERKNNLNFNLAINMEKQEVPCDVGSDEGIRIRCFESSKKGQHVAYERPSQISWW